MKKFNKLYQDILKEIKQTEIFYNIDKKILETEFYDTYTSCFDKKHLDPIDVNFNLICEMNYFDCISQNIENYFIEKFKELYKTKGDGLYTDYIDLTEIINLIKPTDFKQYKGIYNFFELLKSAVGQLTIKISRESNFYLCPLLFANEQIVIIKDNEPYRLNASLQAAGDLYQQYIQKHLKKCFTLNQRIKEFKKTMLETDDWGTININYEYFIKENKIKDLTEVINYEVQHFFRYLVRLNFENWGYFNNYANIPHSDIDMDKIAKINFMDEQDKIEYYLNEDEYDNLSSTYIAYLKKCFKENTDIIDDEHINTYLYVFFDILNFKNNKFKAYANIDLIINYTKAIEKIRVINDIIDFCQITYKDSLNTKHELTKCNRWKEFCLRLIKSLKLIKKYK